jgi:hypothetical protein
MNNNAFILRESTTKEFLHPTTCHSEGAPFATEESPTLDKEILHGVQNDTTQPVILRERSSLAPIAKASVRPKNL